ncbi:hypothetical protein TWF281_008067 [Arthrobotrys megalospora]
MEPLRFGIPVFAVVGVALAQIPPPDGPLSAPTTSSDIPNSVPTGEQPDNVGGGPPATSKADNGVSGTMKTEPTPGPSDSLKATGETSSGEPSPTAAATQTPMSPGLAGGTESGGRSNNNNPVLTGLTALFAVLFAIALALAIFFFIKRRQDRRNGYSTTYSTPESGGYSDKGANAQIETLQSQLADANRRLTSVQGSLLAAGQKPQTKDDNSVSREYTQLSTDVVGWAGNYFKASSDPINLTTELYEFLTEHVPNYQSLLTSGKSKQLVVRAIVSQVLQESFETGAFFGNAMAAITPLVRTSSAPATAINSWRSETFFLLEKSDDFSAQRKAAVSIISDKIEQLTYPLAATKQAFQADPARYKFLEGIIKKAADFALVLGKQRANFQVLSEPAGCEFGYATMDDVSQQTDVITSADGTTSHPLEGRPIQATIFPLLLKYGNESGEGYDQITILSKAKVLV